MRQDMTPCWVKCVAGGTFALRDGRVENLKFQGVRKYCPSPRGRIVLVQIQGGVQNAVLSLGSKLRQNPRNLHTGIVNLDGVSVQDRALKRCGGGKSRVAPYFFRFRSVLNVH
jgi:hypothetical protein